MLVPVLIFMACFGSGIVASARWLPELGPEPVAGLAFFVVCGLLAGALSVAGLHVYVIVNEVDHLSAGVVLSKAEILATGLRNLLFDSGTLAGLACALYVLASRLDRDVPIPPAQG